MVTLRDDQARAIDGAREAFAAGRRSILIVGPTGFGKSVLLGAIARGHVDRGGSVLVVVHRVELVQQLADRLRGFGLDVGEIRPGVSRTRASAQVASIQTLLARGEAPAASLTLWDETHHILATTWSRLRPTDGCLIGLTATPMLADGSGLGAAFETMVVAATRQELRDAGVLVPCEVICPDRALGSGELAQHPVDAYLAHAPNEQGMLFAPSVEHAQLYAAEFVARGVPAACVWGGMKAAARADAMTRFRSGHLQMLTNIAVLSEGVDVPAASVCILARTVGHLGLYDQIVGRVLRAAPGKRRAVLLDLVGATHTYGGPDEERVYSLDGRGIRRAADEIDVRFCPVCGAPVVGESCETCGHAGEMRARPPRVLGLPMTRFAGLRREDDEARCRRLSRWLAQARSKGWREGWCHHRYKAVYGEPIPRQILQRARSMR